MGRITGFLDIERHDRGTTPVSERLRHFREFTVPLSEEETREQAARCMNCGVPFCHGTGSVEPGTPGCPVNNPIPDFNDLVYRGDWREAARNLHDTNNFPEFTGRVCPAPCEASCTLNITDCPVTIRSIECAIVDRAWGNGWLTPQCATEKTGHRVAIIGAGPAGLACAQQLVRAGHDVHVYEKNAKAGGLLRYGIPDFKMEKHIIDRRIAQMVAEGVVFHYNSAVGGNGGIAVRELLRNHDVLALTGGCEVPRDLTIPGRQLGGIHFALDFLTQQNRRVSNEYLNRATDIIARDKHVVVIGGGDTGSDCIGTALRQGARSVTQLEIMPAPPEHENKALTWPNWPVKMRTSTSQAEGAAREYAVQTQAFSGHNGRIKKLSCVRIDDKFRPLPGTEFEIEAELALLAMGFIHPVQEGLLKDLEVELDHRGNVRATPLDYQTSRAGVFAAGDMRRGQSLVVWAIREGRLCARAIDTFLKGRTTLPR